jgi:nucleoside-diphosphate-sugar epimerase
MRVLVAGATGAIGMPLVRALRAGGHEVLGLGRTPASGERLRALGAEPVIADAMDLDGLLAGVRGLHVDAVVHELTALKKIAMRHADMAATDALRQQGTANLLAAARETGARRFVTQSFLAGYGFFDHGTHVLTEEDTFAPPAHDAFEPHVAAMRSAERQTFAAEGIEGIVLRYGGFYGPGAGTEAMVRMLRGRRLPVPRGGGGTISWVYIEDAAAATVAALERGRAGQAYNIVDELPVSWGDFLAALAEAFDAPPPLAVPGWMLRVMPFAYTIFTSDIRLSNAKAKRELGWSPSAPTYRDGIARTAAALGASAGSQRTEPPSPDG